MLSPKLSHTIWIPSVHTGDLETAYGVTVPGLCDYLKTHHVRGMPTSGDLNLMRDCTHLILYNVQSHTTGQIWQELQACLGELADGIAKVKHVSGLNRNPHADVWVQKDVGSSLLSCICDRTRVCMVDWGSLATTARRSKEVVLPNSDVKQEEQTEEMLPRTLPPRDEGCSACVQGWRLALWQPWRERRTKPPQPQPHKLLLGCLPTSVVTYNANGYLSKVVEIEELLDEESVAVLALQETLVTVRHYPLQMQGYRAYTLPAKEDFCGIAMLVTNKLASYEVPHGLQWLIHVKVFNYTGLQGPIHFINVYLKSGGNHRQTRKEQLMVVKNIVAKILEKDSDRRVVVLGDMNEPEKQLIHHLSVVRDRPNHLVPARLVGSWWIHFPKGGILSAIDNILVTRDTQGLFMAGRVLHCYNLSNHCPLVMTPYASLTEVMQRVKPVRPAFDSKMMYLKGDLLVNDNAWTKLMQKAYQEYNVDGNTDPIAGDEWRAEVSDEADKFIDTFDKVCCKHKVKNVHWPGSSPEFPWKLRMIQQTVHKYSKWYHAALDCNRTPDESTCVQLAHAQTHFKKAKKAWQVRM
jgi:hypothetical protein